MQRGERLGPRESLQAADLEYADLRVFRLEAATEVLGRYV